MINCKIFGKLVPWAHAAAAGEWDTQTSHHYIGPAPNTVPVVRNHSLGTLLIIAII